MRIFFIHGFGETPAIFDKIAPAIGGEQVFVDVWKMLEAEDQQALDVYTFAKKMVVIYNIVPADLIIGHSMGGWIAYHIKYLTGCRIVQLASFTNLRKVVAPIRSPKIIYWLVNKGFLFNGVVRWLNVKMYSGLPSMQTHLDNFGRLHTAPKIAAIKQLKLIFEPLDTIQAVPELRIHALKDPIVKPPDEPFYQVPGDHYTLVTHPETVIAPILQLLQTNG